MPELSLALPCWAPPEFPEDGRLLLTQAQVDSNYKKQIQEAEDFKLKLG